MATARRRHESRSSRRGFGALGRIYVDNVRRSITGITLIAGFASTVGWPLGSRSRDDRMAGNVLRLSTARVLIGLPLNTLFLPKTRPPARFSNRSFRLTARWCCYRSPSP